MACVYVLFSESRQHFYIGSSRVSSAEARLLAHNSGKIRSTKHGRPWKIVHEEIFEEYTSARKRELFLKTGIGRESIKATLEEVKIYTER